MPRVLKYNFWQPFFSELRHFQPSPRSLLLYYSIPIQLAAAAISGVGFVLYDGKFLLIGFFFWTLWFATLFLMSVPAADRWLHSRSRQLLTAAKIIFVILLVGGIFQGMAFLVFSEETIPDAPENGFQKSLVNLYHNYGYNDSTALSNQAASNFLEGKNPYKEANVVLALLKYCPYSDRITPLRAGAFADAFPYPGRELMKQVWQKAVQNPEQTVPEYADNFCYPSGDFLIPIPFMLLGISDFRIIYAILVILSLAVVVYLLPSPYRYVFIGGALISLELWNGIACGETGLLVFPFLLLAWFLAGRNLWLSAIFMAIAVSTKQTAWFFLPFYLIMVFKTNTIKKTGITIAMIGLIFLFTNIPFMLGDLSLWFNSVFTPMEENMFPMGVGIVTMVTSGLIDLNSPLVFGILEFVVLAAGIIWYFRYFHKYPISGPILAIFPLFFAWRSLWPYFFYTGLIVLAMILDEEQNKRKRNTLPQMSGKKLIINPAPHS